MHTHPISTDEVFVFPASFAQQRLWFLSQLVPNNPFYNVSAAIRLTGNLNLTALKQTFNEIIRRHEVLRTTFAMEKRELNQVIAESASINLKLVDLQHLPILEREDTARQRAIAFSHLPFNLSTDLLLRVTIFQLDSSDSILLLSLHHIIADGWSIGVLIKEITALYAAFCTNTSLLPDLPIQYADFAAWQKQELPKIIESQLPYWKTQLADLPSLNLPCNRIRNSTQTYKGATYNFLALSHSLSASLSAFNQQKGVTLFMTVLAALQTLLYRYTGQTDIAVGSPIANRNRAELEPLIGFFVNTLVLRVQLSSNLTFLELLAKVKQVTIDAYAHQDLPFEKLVQELQPARDLSKHPLFQVAISLQNTPITALELPELTLNPFEIENGTSKLDLELNFWESSAGLEAQITYSTDLCDRSTILRMAGHLQTLLAGIIYNPQQTLAELPILTATERQQLLIDWNNTQQNYPDKCIQQIFEEQVNNNPSAIALVHNNEQITYQQLNEQSNQIAHHLQNLGVVPDVIVGICLEKSPLIIIAILGILKAGGAYLPIDPEYPKARSRFMLEDSQITILITQNSLFTEEWEHKLVFIEDLAIALQNKYNPTSPVKAANLAYAIYTSGSTGQPKGVLIEHRGLSNVIHAQRQTFDLKPQHRILQFASISFDASIFEIVMGLANGASLYLIPEKSRLGASLTTYLRYHSITHATLPPAVLTTLVAEQLPALQTLILAGEAWTGDIEKWTKNRRLFNAYGLTETSIWSTIAEIGDSISIGNAIANTQVYVLDSNYQPVPIGIPGELYIGGVGIARGYLNRPELTAKSFIPNPFVETLQCNVSPPKFYKTGDLVRYLPNGKLEFLGRIDHQVKIRGYRIELGEIESLLLQHPAIQAVTVITQETAANTQLVAYIVFHPNLNLSTAQLSDFLKEKLPNYSIPSAFVILSSLPLTPNGKVDRNALKSPNISTNKSFVAPRNATESTLTTFWAQTLKLEQVGIQDSFFELGGDSLLAIQLLDQINQHFHQNLPLSALFSAPTVEQFAPNIEKNYIWSPIVPLQPQGAKTPFFCIHPIFGVVLPYYELATHLGKNQPFYALQPCGLDGLQPPLTSIAEMATCYIKALRQIQPKGAYQLGGWSFGGLVAFEMAQQLHQAGETVSKLAIFDTLAPIPSNQPSIWESLNFLITTVPGSIYPFVLDYWELICDSYLKQIFSPHGWTSLLEKATVNSLFPQETRLRMLDELTIERIMRIFWANSQATVNYAPQSYPGAIALFKSNEPLTTTDTTLGWSQLTNSVELHSIPGNHLTMLKTPNVQALAKQLNKYLTA
ncbi:non-ribosomal peptide synthetase [Synechocystis sp. PCC 7509]|uniref:non-ribosomal peptide synthetase n=1 Tax=Synechocystis sp. PCC 7509 TaxID=927677 RepID=UPI0002AC1430|nr:non-ribosomal peptide synthetase [Synechocystis sp. PCC 7509]